MEREEIQNVFALNSEFKEIHISEAKSGRQGYFCIGCKREMQAVKTLIPGRMSYFRHDHNASSGTKCTYSDETYRHKVAKEILLQKKYVKVPSVIKYPSDKISGNPMLISNATVIYAHRVRSEIIIYENDFGEIIWEKTSQVTSSKHLFIKPDIVFFDESDNPILIIELVATHKVNFKKSVILKRLGINAISISIPKGTLQEIGSLFDKVSHTRWIYNFDYDSTEFISDSNSNIEGIPTINDDQRDLLKESLKCRTAQINNLIRSIRKCMDSERFKSASRSIESEILRNEDNTERERNDLEQKEELLERGAREILDRIRNDITRKHQERRANVGKAKRIIEFEEQSIQKKFDELAELQRKTIENHRSELVERHGRFLEEKYRSTISNLETRRNELEERYRRTQNAHIETIEEQTESIRVLRRIIDRESENFRNFESDQRTTEKSIDTLRRRIEEERASIQKYERKGTEFEKRGCDIRNEQERIIETIGRARQQEECDGKSSGGEGIGENENRGNIGSEISRLLAQRKHEAEIFILITEAKANNRRIKQAIDIVRCGTYKNWHE